MVKFIMSIFTGTMLFGFTALATPLVAKNLQNTSAENYPAASPVLSWEGCHTPGTCKPLFLNDVGCSVGSCKPMWLAGLGSCIRAGTCGPTLSNNNGGTCDDVPNCKATVAEGVGAAGVSGGVGVVSSDHNSWVCGGTCYA